MIATIRKAAGLGSAMTLAYELLFDRLVRSREERRDIIALFGYPAAVLLPDTLKGRSFGVGVVAAMHFGPEVIKARKEILEWPRAALELFDPPYS